MAESRPIAGSNTEPVTEPVTESFKERPVHVCHIFPSLPLHGAENHFLKLCKNLDHSKVRTTILVIQSRGELAPDFEALGIPVTLVPKRSRYDLSVVPRIREYLNKGDFDLVHTHLFTANFWGRLGALGRPQVLVSSAHNVVAEERPLLVRVENLLDRILTLGTDAVFCVTGQVAASMRHDAGLPPGKLVPIENGLSLPPPSGKTKAEIRRELGLPEDRIFLAVIGRFSTQKNHRGFLEALGTVVARHPEVLVLFAGEGELEGEIRAEAESRGLIPFLRFLGLRRDVPRILEALDLFVLPSLWEGLPNVMLEAMAAGVPVVATRVGGVPDVLTDGETGILCETSSSAIAEGILRALDHRQDSERMAEKARTLIRERYDIRNTARRYTGFYRTLVRTRAFRGSRKGISLLRSAAGSFLSRPAPAPGTLRILMYHRVAETMETDILAVTPFAFAQQMRWLREEGWSVLSLLEALRRLESGTLPPKAAAITFDDGYRDNYDEAAPVLAGMHFPATVFPVTAFVLEEAEHRRYRGRVPKVPYLTVEQIRQMKRAGFDFGGHTHTHPLLSTISGEAAQEEILRAKKLLEEWTGEKSTLFAYPNGIYGKEHFRILDALGYEAALTVRPGANRPGTYRFALLRTEVSGRDSLGDFIRKMNGGFDLIHRVTQSVRGFYRCATLLSGFFTS